MRNIYHLLINTPEFEIQEDMIYRGPLGNIEKTVTRMYPDWTSLVITVVRKESHDQTGIEGNRETDTASTEGREEIGSSS